ncbi:MAG TPA: penicillin-binding protein [Chryseobacterium carnipullorum]|nr:penicillin-binding protein [Chryseobacterium carnipullorum]
MTLQRAHINVNLCDSPSIKELFGYEWMIWNEAKCACFENYLQ